MQSLAKLLLLPEESYYRAVVQVHNMVTHFCAHCIRLGFEIVDLSDTQFDFVQCLAELVLALLLFALEDSVDFGFHLLRLFEECAEELVPLMHLNLRLVLVKPQIFLCLCVAQVALLHVVVSATEPLLVLVHAECQ